MVHVYDLVDWVTEAGYQAGESAAKHAAEVRDKEAHLIPMVAGDNIRYIVPHMLDKRSLEENEIRLQMRVTKPVEQPVWVEVHNENNLVTRRVERYVRPGEMVTIVLKPKDFAEVQKAGSLTVDIVPR